ncbi:hypothetical protein D5X65_02960 [Salmonella enterica subsp. enterica serovar Suberu]|nr:hypothetical protein [Salmonella enterica subsp. enterica serovar Suberu]
MFKYQLRKIDPQSRREYRYSTCDEFASFSDLRDAINTRNDIWYGDGFDVLDSEGEVLFDKDVAGFCIQQFGKKFTLRQATEKYGELK